MSQGLLCLSEAQHFQLFTLWGKRMGRRGGKSIRRQHRGVVACSGAGTSLLNVLPASPGAVGVLCQQGVTRAVLHTVVSSNESSKTLASNMAAI